LRATVLAALAALCGCAAPPAALSPSVCPLTETYSADENQALASELSTLPPDDVLVKVANEDHRLRVELQACRR
jgi:hypothetical protein